MDGSGKDSAESVEEVGKLREIQGQVRNARRVKCLHTAQHTALCPFQIRHI